MSKVSVIIPFYKVAGFIESCAVSLMEQTYENIEFIFVDDCSPDDSMEILQKVLDQYPDRTVSVVRHEVNKGLPAARNTGMKCATGDFIYHCDSDDWLETNALELMVKSAEKNDSEVVWCDWLLSFEHNERYMKQPNYTNAREALEGMLTGTMKYNVWNKLVKRSLYVDNRIEFPSGYSMGEDMTMIRLMCCAQKVSYVPHALYHYVKTNGEAFTNNFTQKKLEDVAYNVGSTLKFLMDRMPGQLDLEMACFKLNVKLPLLMTDDENLYRYWINWYPESNKYILQNKNASFRCRILQYAALKRQFWIIKAYYKFVYSFVYGYIYK